MLLRLAVLHNIGFALVQWHTQVLRLAWNILPNTLSLGIASRYTKLSYSSGGWWFACRRLGPHIPGCTVPNSDPKEE